ncbi:MAG: ABC transporter permease [Clostridia bacterium]|nr:ABC transporter permease [Clostridia bacterium]
MFKYIIKRLAIAVLVLFGVSVIIYSLVRLMPSDFVDQKYQPLVQNGQMDPARLVELKELYGIADRSFGGLVKGYFKWVGNALRGDLGYSFKYESPVSEVIFRNMGISFLIAFLSLILEYIIAIPLGIKAATHQYGFVDYSATVLSMIGISLPSFFLGALFIRLFSVQLGWFEPGGLISSNIPNNASGFTILLNQAWHLIMPMAVLVILSIGGLMRYTRTNTLEVLNADYIRTARAKGVSERSVIYKHAFRNTMIPLVTMFAGTLPGLFGGAMITEEVFSIPGIGRMAYQALQEGDVPFIMGYNMFLAILTVIGTLLSDVMYAVVDPRVKLTK